MQGVSAAPKTEATSTVAAMLKRAKPTSTAGSARLSKEQLELKVAELIGNPPPYTPSMFEHFKKLSALQKQGQMTPSSVEYEQLKMLQQQLARAKYYCAPSTRMGRC